MKAFRRDALSFFVLGLTGAVGGASVVGGCVTVDANSAAEPDSGITATNDGSTSPKDSGITPDSGGSTAARDSGSTPDASTDASTDAGWADAGPAPELRTGTVTFTQSLTNAPVYSVAATATFVETGEGLASPTVTTVLDSACTLQIYTPPADVGTADAAVAAAPNASTITITDNTSQFGFPENVTLTTDTNGDGLYAPFSGSAPAGYFVGGDSIGFQSPGNSASVGHFTTMVTAPADITVTSPTITKAAAISIPTTQPLAVSWSWIDSRTAGTQVQVKLHTSSYTTSAFKTLTCTFDADALAGSVPAADLQQLDEVGGDGKYSGTVYVTPVSSATSWATVDGADAGTTRGASNQDWLVTTTVEGTPIYGPYTN